MKYKLVIFDFDGTLADTFPFFLETVNQLADLHRFRKLDIANIDALRHYDARQMIDHLGLPLWKVPMVGRSFSRKMAENAHRISLFAGIDAMLDALSGSGLALSLITSNSADNARTILRPRNFGMMANPQCGAALFGKRARLKTVLRKTGVSAREAIFIGDEVRDLEAARSENVDFGAVSWGYMQPAALRAHAPTEMFDSIDDIVKKMARPKG